MIGPPFILQAAHNYLKANQPTMELQSEKNKYILTKETVHIVGRTCLLFHGLRV